MAAASDKGMMMMMMLMQQCVFEGCISDHNSEIQRRPYHRNCGCALHRSRTACSHSSPRSSNNVSYPIRRSWSNGSFTLSMSSSSSSSSSCCSTPNSCYCSSINGDHHSLSSSSSSASPSSPPTYY